jgi:hypothetical protein
MVLSGLFSVPLSESGFLLGAASGLGITAWRLLPGTRPIWSSAPPGQLLALGFLIGLLLVGGIGDAVVTGEAALPLSLPLGLVLLVLAQWAADKREAPLWLRGIYSLPAVALISGATGLPDAWLALVVGASILLLSPIVASFELSWAPLRLTFPMMLLTSLGIYYTVPDPEEAMVLLGVALSLTPLTLAPAAPRGSAFAGATCYVAVVAWVSAAGGFGRPSSVLGGILAIGLPAIEPLARRAFSGGKVVGRPTASIRILFLLTQGLLVVAASRVVGLQETAVVSVLLGVALVVVGFIMLGTAEAIAGSVRDGRRKGVR